jgi:uncharacterized protein DUF4177
MGVSVEPLTEPAVAHAIRRYEYRIIDTGDRVEEELNELGAEGWQVVGVTTKKQLFIAPPAAIILMRELQP